VGAEGLRSIACLGVSPGNPSLEIRQPLSPPDNRDRLDLGTIIAALHNSEINGEVSWFFDGVWRVKLGDEMNGFDAEATVSSPQEAAE
jgi:hypothetical protein